MTNKGRILVGLPASLVKRIDTMIDAGLFNSRTDFLKEATRRQLEHAQNEFGMDGGASHVA